MMTHRDAGLFADIFTGGACALFGMAAIFAIAGWWDSWLLTIINAVLLSIVARDAGRRSR